MYALMPPACKTYVIRTIILVISWLLIYVLFNLYNKNLLEQSSSRTQIITNKIQCNSNLNNNQLQVICTHHERIDEQSYEPRHGSKVKRQVYKGKQSDGYERKLGESNRNEIGKEPLRTGDDWIIRKLQGGNSGVDQEQTLETQDEIGRIPDTENDNDLQTVVPRDENYKNLEITGTQKEIDFLVDFITKYYIKEKARETWRESDVNTKINLVNSEELNGNQLMVDEIEDDTHSKIEKQNDNTNNEHNRIPIETKSEIQQNPNAIENDEIRNYYKGRSHHQPKEKSSMQSDAENKDRSLGKIDLEKYLILEYMTHARNFEWKSRKQRKKTNGKNHKEEKVHSVLDILNAMNEGRYTHVKNSFINSLDTRGTIGLHLEKERSKNTTSPQGLGNVSDTLQKIKETPINSIQTRDIKKTDNFTTSLEAISDAMKNNKEENLFFGFGKYLRDSGTLKHGDKSNEKQQRKDPLRKDVDVLNEIYKDNKQDKEYNIYKDSRKNISDTQKPNHEKNYDSFRKKTNILEWNPGVFEEHENKPNATDMKESPRSVFDVLNALYENERAQDMFFESIKENVSNEEHTTIPYESAFYVMNSLYKGHKHINESQSNSSTTNQTNKKKKSDPTHKDRVNSESRGVKYMHTLKPNKQNLRKENRVEHTTIPYESAFGVMNSLYKGHKHINESLSNSSTTNQTNKKKKSDPTHKDRVNSESRGVKYMHNIKPNKQNLRKENRVSDIQDLTLRFNFKGHLSTNEDALNSLNSKHGLDKKSRPYTEKKDEIYPKQRNVHILDRHGGTLDENVVNTLKNDNYHGKNKIETAIKRNENPSLKRSSDSKPDKIPQNFNDPETMEKMSDIRSNIGIHKIDENIRRPAANFYSIQSLQKDFEVMPIRHRNNQHLEQKNSGDNKKMKGLIAKILSLEEKEEEHKNELIEALMQDDKLLSSSDKSTFIDNNDQSWFDEIIKHESVQNQDNRSRNDKARKKFSGPLDDLKHETDKYEEETSGIFARGEMDSVKVNKSEDEFKLSQVFSNQDSFDTSEIGDGNKYRYEEEEDNGQDSSNGRRNEFLEDLMNYLDNEENFLRLNQDFNNGKSNLNERPSFVPNINSKVDTDHELKYVKNVLTETTPNDESGVKNQETNLQVNTKDRFTTLKETLVNEGSVTSTKNKPENRIKTSENTSTNTKNETKSNDNTERKTASNDLNNPYNFFMFKNNYFSNAKEAVVGTTETIHKKSTKVEMKRMTDTLILSKTTIGMKSRYGQNVHVEAPSKIIETKRKIVFNDTLDEQNGMKILKNKADSIMLKVKQPTETRIIQEHVTLKPRVHYKQSKDNQQYENEKELFTKEKTDFDREKNVFMPEPQKITAPKATNSIIYSMTTMEMTTTQTKTTTIAYHPAIMSKNDAYKINTNQSESNYSIHNINSILSDQKLTNSLITPTLRPTKRLLTEIPNLQIKNNKEVMIQSKLEYKTHEDKLKSFQQNRQSSSLVNANLFKHGLSLSQRQPLKMKVADVSKTGFVVRKPIQILHKMKTLTGKSTKTKKSNKTFDGIKNKPVTDHPFLAKNLLSFNKGNSQQTRGNVLEKPETSAYLHTKDNTLTEQKQNRVSEMNVTSSNETNPQQIQKYTHSINDNDTSETESTTDKVKTENIDHVDIAMTTLNENVSKGIDSLQNCNSKVSTNETHSSKSDATILSEKDYLQETVNNLKNKRKVSQETNENEEYTKSSTTKRSVNKTTSVISQAFHTSRNIRRKINSKVSQKKSRKKRFYFTGSRYEKTKLDPSLHTKNCTNNRMTHTISRTIHKAKEFRKNLISIFNYILQRRPQSVSLGLTHALWKIKTALKLRLIPIIDVIRHLANLFPRDLQEEFGHIFRSIAQLSHNDLRLAASDWYGSVDNHTVDVRKLLDNVMDLTFRPIVDKNDTEFNTDCYRKSVDTIEHKRVLGEQLTMISGCINQHLICVHDDSLWLFELIHLLPIQATTSRYEESLDFISSQLISNKREMRLAVEKSLSQQEDSNIVTRGIYEFLRGLIQSLSTITRNTSLRSACLLVTNTLRLPHLQTLSPVVTSPWQPLPLHDYFNLVITDLNTPYDIRNTSRHLADAIRTNKLFSVKTQDTLFPKMYIYYYDTTREILSAILERLYFNVNVLGKRFVNDVIVVRSYVAYTEAYITNNLCRIESLDMFEQVFYTSRVNQTLKSILNLMEKQLNPKVNHSCPILISDLCLSSKLPTDPRNTFLQILDFLLDKYQLEANITELIQSFLTVYNSVQEETTDSTLAHFGNRKIYNSLLGKSNLLSEKKKLSPKVKPTTQSVRDIQKSTSDTQRVQETTTLAEQTYTNEQGRNEKKHNQKYETNDVGQDHVRLTVPRDNKVKFNESSKIIDKRKTETQHTDFPDIATSLSRTKERERERGKVKDQGSDKSWDVITWDFGEKVNKNNFKINVETPGDQELHDDKVDTLTGSVKDLNKNTTDELIVDKIGKTYNDTIDAFEMNTLGSTRPTNELENNLDNMETRNFQEENKALNEKTQSTPKPPCLRCNEKRSKGTLNNARQLPVYPDMYTEMMPRN